MTLGTGVGGGVIAAGNLIRGVKGAGGELGHITVDFDAPFACTCGKKVVWKLLLQQQVL